MLNGDDLGMVYGIGFTTLNDLVDGFKHDSVIHDASFQVHQNSGAQVLGISWYC